MVSVEDSEVREVTPGTMDGRRWEVVGPDDITFVVTATDRALLGTPGGTPPIGRAWSEYEIRKGLLGAVQLSLVRPPEKVGGETYEINLTSRDLYEANGRL